MADEFIKLYDSQGNESQNNAQVFNTEDAQETDEVRGKVLSLIDGILKWVNIETAWNRISASIISLQSTISAWFNVMQQDTTAAIGRADAAAVEANTQAEAARQAAADRTVPQLTDIADSSYGSDEKILSILGTVIKKMTPTGLMKFIFGKLSATTFGNNDLVMGCDASNNPKKGTMAALTDVVTGHLSTNAGRGVVSSNQSICSPSSTADKMYKIARDAGGYGTTNAGVSVIDVYFTTAFGNNGSPYLAKFNIVYAVNSGSPNPRNPAAIYIERVENSSALANIKFYADADGYVYVTSPSGWIYGWTVIISKHGNFTPIMCEEYTGETTGFTELTPKPRTTVDLNSVLGNVSPVDMISTDYIVGLNSNMQTKVSPVTSFKSVLTTGSYIEPTDFNNITTAGVSLAATTSQTLNMPDSTAYIWWLRVEVVSTPKGVRIMQEAIRYDSPSIVKRRFRTSGGWGTWA